MKKLKPQAPKSPKPTNVCDVGRITDGKKCAGLVTEWKEMDHFGKEHGREFAPCNVWHVCMKCRTEKMKKDPPRLPRNQPMELDATEGNEGEDVVVKSGDFFAGTYREKLALRRASKWV